MMLHYHEYSENLEATRDRVLDWLELPHAGPGEPFHTGKVYRHYYSLEQRRAIRAFLKEFSSVETWQQIKDYGKSADGLFSNLELAFGLTHCFVQTLKCNPRLPQCRCKSSLDGDF